MSEFGLKIKNIEAATLYEYNKGLRDHYEYKEAMFVNSLFKDFLYDHGLNIWNNESTRDLICLEFNFGTRNYEKEIKHIQILHYYYGKNNRCFKESLVFVLKELVFYQFICMFVVIRDVSIIPIQGIIVNSMLYTIITGIVILCHFLIKYRYIKCLEASNDWLLVTEFE